ncbi:MAG: response regulator [Alphaproteobacteria bacterium]|nr:response regulator [Alphaproteobacteria bacterium]TAD87428.1 MAG: response regulator [Alphaproteobacteria bacterium]
MAAPLTVLIVEDDALIAMGFAAALEDLGHRILGPVADLDTALALAAADRPMCALVDVRLGASADGVDVALALRERFDVPSLFVSGTLDAETRARAESAKPIAHLSKPVAPEEIDRRLREAFAA